MAAEGSMAEVASLRAQLDDKNRQLEQMRHQHERAGTARDDEEKLIIAAWYNLGLRLNTQAPEERLATKNAGQSFLARQRAAHGGGASVAASMVAPVGSGSGVGGKGAMQ